MEIKITTETKKLYNGKPLEKLKKTELIALVKQMEREPLKDLLYKLSKPQPMENLRPIKSPWDLNPYEQLKLDEQKDPLVEPWVVTSNGE